MSMSGMSHGSHDMSGMTMSGGVFTRSDETYARGFWYGVAGCIGLLTLTKAASTVQSKQRLKRQRRDPQSVPSRPTGWISQAYATTTAVVREMSYSQPVYFTGRFSKYFSPLPIGRWLLLAFYWIIILSFLWTDTILTRGDPMYAYKWEKVGFRAAWVTVTQVPFVFLLSCKFNPISVLTGISYERFNWLHRWAARTMWLTAIVHWSFFYTEWSLAKIVTMQMDMMPMVRYGFGAWGVITWMLLSGFGFFRDLCYELFVLQHIAAAGTLLWLLFVHVPSYARYNIWMSVAFVVFDWGVRIIWGITRNMHLLRRSESKGPGYNTHLEALPGNVVRLTIPNPDFTWQAGQHAYLYMPGLRPLEFHPFTIASNPSSGNLSMLIQARSGFSKTLHTAASKATSSPSSWRQRAFISGPWGAPPDVSHYETVVLIACSTGATFILPILQDLLQRETCIRTIHLHWIIRSEDYLVWFEEALKSAVQQAQQSQKSQLCVTVHITQATSSSSSSPNQLPLSQPSLDSNEKSAITTTTTRTTTTTTHRKSTSTSSSASQFLLTPDLHRHPHPPPQASSFSISSSTRPSIPSLLRPPIERARGETAIIACGNGAFAAETRTFVARISDERAVHKGTGAQGVFLFCETYGW